MICSAIRESALTAVGHCDAFSRIPGQHFGCRSIVHPSRMLQYTLSPDGAQDILSCHFWLIEQLCGAQAPVWFLARALTTTACAPSLACLDVKMYNFLNSEACICTVQDLHTIRALSTTAQAQLKITLIGTTPPHAPMCSSST